MHLRWIAGLALAQASLSLAADTHWPITLPELARDELVAIALPPSLYAQGQADAATLRVQDDRGSDIPAHVEAVQTVTHSRRRVSRAPFDLLAAELPDDKLRLTLRRPVTTPPEGAIEGLAIQTPLRDFEQRATVEISDDGDTWTPLVSQATIFDFSRHADVRRTDIPLPGHITNRYLRLTFEQAVDVREQLTALITDTRTTAGDTAQSRAVHVDSRPFHVEAVRGWASSPIESSRKPVLVDTPIDWMPLTNGVPRGRTRYAIASRGQPLTRLNLTLPGDYVSWRYTLTSDPATPSGALARGMLTQFRFRGVTDAATSIVFPETRAERCLLTLDHPDAIVSGIAAQGPAYGLVFPAQPLRRYTLIQLGEPEERHPGVAKIADLLAKGVQPLAATIEATPGRTTSRMRGADWLRRHALTAGIGVALLALAAALAGALRRMNPPHDG